MILKIDNKPIPNQTYTYILPLQILHQEHHSYKRRGEVGHFTNIFTVNCPIFSTAQIRDRSPPKWGGPIKATKIPKDKTRLIGVTGHFVEGQSTQMF